MTDDRRRRRAGPLGPHLGAPLRGPLLLLLTCALILPSLPTGRVTRAEDTPLVMGARTTGAPEDPTQLDAYADRVGAMPGIVMWYQDWTDRLFSPRSMDAVVARGAVPMVTWEPFDETGGVNQPRFGLRTITSGAHDAYIRESARSAADWGKPFYLRLAHEMNGDWYPWGRGVNGNRSGDYVAAWRHVVNIFRSEGATNAIWVWAPNVDYLGMYPFNDLYPGDGYVDWTGLDGYNWGSLKQSGWRSLASVFGASYDTLTGITGKPVMIAETATTERGGDKAAWIRDGLLKALPTRMPRVQAVIWFDRNKETDWRVNSSPSALAAFREVVAAPLYDGSLLSCVVDRPSAYVSSLLTVTCTGFAPGEEVRLTWDSRTAPQLGGFTADRLGAGAGALKVRDTPRGTHKVAVHGVSSGRSVRVPVFIKPHLRLSPDSGVSGTRVTATLRGYERGETITVRWVTSSQTTTVATVVTSATGTAAPSFTVPRSLSKGYRVEAVGNRGSRGADTFTVVSPSPSAARWDASPARTATATPMRTTRATATSSPGVELTATTPPETATVGPPTETPAPESTSEPTPVPSEEPVPEPTQTQEPTTTPEPIVIVEPTSTTMPTEIPLPRTIELTAVADA